MLCSALSACTSGEDTAVMVEIVHAADGPGLDAVSVVSGGDDFYWPRIEAGETQAVTLHPGPADSREVILLFTLGEVRHDWTGPRVATGAGFRVRLAVSTNGEVVHRQCLSPCSLD